MILMVKSDPPNQAQRRLWADTARARPCRPRDRCSTPASGTWTTTSWTRTALPRTNPSRRFSTSEKGGRWGGAWCGRLRGRRKTRTRSTRSSPSGCDLVTRWSCASSRRTPGERLSDHRTPLLGTAIENPPLHETPAVTTKTNHGTFAALRPVRSVLPPPDVFVARRGGVRLGLRTFSSDTASALLARPGSVDTGSVRRRASR